MFKQAIIGATALLIAMPASAEVRKTMRDATYEDVYVYEEMSTPIYYEQCKNIRVPQKNGASGGDVLGGMILGGLLGKGLTGDDGGAAAGAVLGGIITADKNQGNGGSRIERQCETITEYKTQYKKIYSHSIMRFTENGRKRRLEVVLPWK